MDCLLSNGSGFRISIWLPKKFGNQPIFELFLLFSAVKNLRFEAAFFLVSNPLVTSKRVTKKQPRGCFFACPMEIRRLAMRQSGGLSLARPMPDCLHQKHLAICRIASSIAPPSATPIFLQRKNANERKRVTKKLGNQPVPELFLLFSAAKNSRFKSRFSLVSNPLVTAKLPFIKGSPLLFSCVADVGKAADKPRGILQ